MMGVAFSDSGVSSPFFLLPVYVRLNVAERP
jgi:hypothetical protein